MGVRRSWMVYELHCRILDSPFGGYNGYVAVPKGHPAWGQRYDDLPVDVHGGLTFGKQGSNHPNERRPEALWPDAELYWFGFDTAHLGDWVDYASERGGRRWSIEDVARETEALAKQFAEMDRVIFLDYDARYKISEYYGQEFLDKLLRGELQGSNQKVNQE